MHIVTAKENNVSRERKVVNVKLPEDWWNETYSYNFFAKDDNSKAKIIHIKKHNINKLEKEVVEEILPIPHEWDFTKGDYRIQERGSTDQQYAYNDRLKLRIIKYSIYPAVFLSLVLTFIVLSAIVGS